MIGVDMDIDERAGAAAGFHSCGSIDEIRPDNSSAAQVSRATRGKKMIVTARRRSMS